jgi:hypothetical protein
MGLNWTTIIVALISAIIGGGGGVIAALKLGPETRKIEAETQNIEADQLKTIIDEQGEYIERLSRKVDSLCVRMTQYESGIELLIRSHTDNGIRAPWRPGQDPAVAWQNYRASAGGEEPTQW